MIALTSTFNAGSPFTPTFHQAYRPAVGFDDKPHPLGSLPGTNSKGVWGRRIESRANCPIGSNNERFGDGTPSRLADAIFLSKALTGVTCACDGKGAGEAEAALSEDIPSSPVTKTAARMPDIRFIEL